MLGFLLIGLTAMYRFGQSGPAELPAEEVAVQPPTATPSPTSTPFPPTNTPPPTPTSTKVVLPTNTPDPVVQEDLQPVAITEPDSPDNGTDETGGEDTAPAPIESPAEPTEEPLSEAIPKSGGVLTVNQSVFVTVLGFGTLLMLIVVGLFALSSRR